MLIDSLDKPYFLSSPKPNQGNWMGDPGATQSPLQHGKWQVQPLNDFTLKICALTA